MKMPDLKKHLTPHSLRHSHTSFLAKTAVELLQITDRLGHLDDVIIIRVYLHLTKEKKKLQILMSRHQYGIKIVNLPLEPL